MTTDRPRWDLTVSAVQRGLTFKKQLGQWDIWHEPRDPAYRLVVVSSRRNPENWHNFSRWSAKYGFMDYDFGEATPLLLCELHRLAKLCEVHNDD